MYLFATMLFALLASAPAYAVECRTSWEADGHWYWRMIDERKCWYQGHRLIPKDGLHWP